MGIGDQMIQTAYLRAADSLDELLKGLAQARKQSPCTDAEVWARTLAAFIHSSNVSSQYEQDFNFAIYAAAIVRLHLMSIVDVERPMK